jgi:hypothetical protein
MGRSFARFRLLSKEFGPYFAAFIQQEDGEVPLV